MRMRFKCFARRNTFLGRPYGANNQYFKYAHASGTRQRTIMSAASTCVPEMVNSVVVSRRANMLFTPAGLLENAGSLSHSSILFMWAFGLPRTRGKSD
jgi:hypothetical protein